MSTTGPVVNSAVYTDDTPVVRKSSRHSSTSKPSYADEKGHPTTTAPAGAPEGSVEDEEPSKTSQFMKKYRPFILAALALAILGWWISSTVLKATRHRWVVQTICAWCLIAVIAFRYIPNRVITRPIEAVWVPLVQRPWNALPYYARLAIGWLCLLGVVFGSAFGFRLEGNTTYGDRAISVFGLFIFQFAFWATSHSRKNIQWSTVIVGLFMQQVIAMFVLKSRAGFDLFNWLATAAADFLTSAEAGSRFFFGDGLVDQHLFFTNTLAAIIFFIAFVQMLYYLGVMQWVIGHFAWFFFKVMNVSGAEAVIAAGSPFVGQGESACLVKPYVDLMTPSELHLAMTSGFSTIAGSVLTAYISLGVPAVNLVTSSVMSIPASIAISKMRYPELEEPITRGRVVVERGEEKDATANALHAFSKGAVFGLVVAGMILCNVLTVIALITVIDGLLTWIGRGFGIHHLTLQLIFGYIFYPVTFLMGVPRPEILRVSRLLATKFVANEFVAYLDLKAITEGPNPLSHRAYNIASYALCGFANLSSVGIQIGVLGAMAPSRQKVISKIAFSAMIAGFIATMQTAGIAGMLL